MPDSFQNAEDKKCPQDFLKVKYIFVEKNSLGIMGEKS
jgi:hypothetical protein